jgi:signal transduction histidine kinase
VRSDTLHSMINLIGTIPHWADSIRTVITQGSFVEKSKALEYLDKLDRDISVVGSEITQLRGSSISRSELDLAKLTGGIIAELEAMFGSSIIFNFDYDPSAYILNGVEFNVREALYNILHNAVEAILKKNSNTMGLVSVKLSKETIDNSDKIIMFIKDNGVGISHENWESIFELGISSQGKYLASDWGYGLWRSKSILNGLGGNISVIESTPGVGSTFKIILNT